MKSHNILRFCQLLALFITLFSLNCQPRYSPKLTIATAANMQFAMGELTESFSEEMGIDCETIISSSGKLTAQILEGAPFDVFVSADMKYPKALYQKGMTTAAPEIYAYGKLVLWSRVEDLQPSIDNLTQDQISHIALANPKTAPYGATAVEVLQHFGIFEQVKNKLVYGESIAQTNQFITTGAAEIGFTAKAVVLSPKQKNKGRWTELAPETYTPIAQGIVLLKNQQDRLYRAEKFYNFLFSAKGREILANFGFSTTSPSYWSDDFKSSDK